MDHGGTLTIGAYGQSGWRCTGRAARRVLLCRLFAFARRPIVCSFAMCLSIGIDQRPVALLAFHLSLDPGRLGGVETQRQWSDRASARTTPILMGLISCVTRAAHRLQQQHPIIIIHRTTAWYARPAPNAT